MSLRALFGGLFIARRGHMLIEIFSHTPALALVIAALKARESDAR